MSHINYNFALVELNGLAGPPYQDQIRPVCLPADPAETYAGSQGVATGWGDTDPETGPEEAGTFPSVLQEVDMWVSGAASSSVLCTAILLIFYYINIFSSI